MLIPLWLPWAVVVALVLPFFLNVLKYEVPPPPGQEESARSRHPRPAPGLGEAWGEGALVVALVVAVALTFDRVHVSNDELNDAVEQVTGAIDGTPGSSAVGDRVAAGVRDRLGRAVDVEEVETDESEESDGSDGYGYGGGGEYEVRLEDHDDGPVSCLEVSVSGPATVQYVSFSQSTSECS